MTVETEEDQHAVSEIAYHFQADVWMGIKFMNVSIIFKHYKLQLIKIMIIVETRGHHELISLTDAKVKKMFVFWFWSNAIVKEAQPIKLYQDNSVK